eukprot:249891-Chlamydomonas_euryale.AAC.3
MAAKRRQGWTSDGQTRPPCICVFMHFKCLRRIVGVKPRDHHKLEAVCEQRGTFSLELMVRRRTLWWMGHVLRMGEDCLPWPVFDCSFASSIAEHG